MSRDADWTTCKRRSDVAGDVDDDVADGEVVALGFRGSLVIVASAVDTEVSNW